MPQGAAAATVTETRLSRHAVVGRRLLSTSPCNALLSPTRASSVRVQCHHWPGVLFGGPAGWRAAGKKRVGPRPRDALPSAAEKPQPARRGQARLAGRARPSHRVLWTIRSAKCVKLGRALPKAFQPCSSGYCKVPGELRMNGRG